MRMKAEKPILNQLELKLAQVDEDFPEEKQVLADKFWLWVSEQGGTPILEEHEGEFTATFLYRSREKLDIVLDCLDLRERLIGIDDVLQGFKQIEGTDIYYLKVDRLPRETCIPYEIEINGKSEPDTFNPTQFQLLIYNPGTNCVVFAERKSSVLNIGSPKQPFWCSNKIPDSNGSISTVFIEGEADGINFGERKCWIYKPPAFDANRNDPYKVMLVLDGSTYITITPPCLDNYANESMDLSNTIVAFIGNVNPESVKDRFRQEKKGFEDHRQYEYISHGKAFSKFVVETVLPQLRSPELSLNLSIDAHDTIVAGFSMAGHCAAEMGLNYSDKIGGIILLSPAMNNRGGTLIDEYSLADKKELSIYVSIGKFEDRVPNDPLVIAESRLSVDRRFVETLESKGYSVHLEELPIGHSELMSIECMVQGLEHLCKPEDVLKSTYHL
ncbi:MAG: alpha/beta hydrolase-fold protein [Legionella sp.]|nr:alpha/beta hydrolase-fold protein [Legionella sp.]